MNIFTQNLSFNCKFHSNENVTYLKVNDFKNNDKIFYCDTCIEEIDCFITQNFLRIKNILQSDDQLILKWPPLDNTKVNSQIKQIIEESKKQKNQNIENEIVQFFDQLKEQILKKIDHSQKSMIQLASEVQKQNENTLQQLIDFSKVDILQQILKNTNFDMMEKEKQLREIINKAQVEKEKNLQYVAKIVNEVNKQIRNNKFEISQDLNKSILTLIDQINFFNKDINILPGFELQNTPYVGNDKQQYPKNLQIERLFDNCIEVRCQKYDVQQFYSDLIFEQNKKYTFRFEVEAHSFENQYIHIGITDDKTKHLNYNIKDNNQFIIFYQQKFLKDNKMINLSLKNLKVEKGEKEVKEMKMVELRVNLQNQMVEILDFPNYINQFSIDDSIKNKLTQNHFRLHLFQDGQITVRVKSAFICEQFE